MKTRKDKIMCHYTCGSCGGRFESERSDQEALTESVALFGKHQAKDLAVVCDDCFRAITTSILDMALGAQDHRPD